MRLSLLLVLATAAALPALPAESVALRDAARAAKQQAKREAKAVRKEARAARRESKAMLKAQQAAAAPANFAVAPVANMDTRSGAVSTTRRVWILATVICHVFYAALFLWRSFYYQGVGDSARPFYYESAVFGWLVPKPLQTALGWEKEYDANAVLDFVKAANADAKTYASLGKLGEWFTACAGSPTFMYWYQLAEGIFHLMICLGGVVAFLPAALAARPRFLSLYRFGLFSELIFMDIGYIIAFTAVGFMKLDGFPHLPLLLMLYHHATAVPDIASSFIEARLAKAGQ